MSVFALIQTCPEVPSFPTASKRNGHEQRKHPLQAFCLRTRAGQDPDPRSTTKVLKLFVSLCEVEPKKSEAGAVTEDGEKAEELVEG